MAQVDLAGIPEVLGAAFVSGDPGYATKLQEQENLALLSHLVALISTGDFARVRECLSPELEFELFAPPGFPWVREARGPDAVAAALAANFSSVREQRPEVLSLAAQGDTIMLMIRESGRWAESGEPYEVMTAQQYRFEGGRLSRFRSVVASLG